MVIDSLIETFTLAHYCCTPQGLSFLISRDRLSSSCEDSVVILLPNLMRINRNRNIKVASSQERLIFIERVCMLGVFAVRFNELSMCAVKILI